MSKEQKTTTTGIIELVKAPYVRIAEVDGKQILLYARPIQTIDYQDCQVYSLPASRGKIKGEKEFFVNYTDYKKPEGKNRQSQIDKIKSMKSQGLTDAQIVASLLNK